jgi:hypothetical protein
MSPILFGPIVAVRLAAWQAEEKMPGGGWTRDCQRGRRGRRVASRFVEDATRDGECGSWNASRGAAGLAWERSAQRETPRVIGRS